MTTNMVTARRKGDPQHYVEGIVFAKIWIYYMSMNEMFKLCLRGSGYILASPYDFMASWFSRAKCFAVHVDIDVFAMTATIYRYVVGILLGKSQITSNYVCPTPILAMGRA